LRPRGWRLKRKHGISLEKASEIFDQAHIVDRPSDAPEQFRAIGWCRARLCAVIFEIRTDSDGDYYHLVTAWKATALEERKTSKAVPTADPIAEMASRGEDVSRPFTNKFTVVQPIHRVNVDLTSGMLRELDARAARLTISRQAVIKTLLRRALDETQPARQRRKKQAR
jgi:uncharacterized DUF497 family protein